MVSFENYEPVIGFECHVQLKTASKLFSPCKNQYGAKPNELVDVIDLGLPGVLPSLNKQAVAFAIKLGLALGCEIRRTSVFSRKHYFYPDLPKGYQISQFDKPICENGVLTILLNGQKKDIRIMRIHIEEDAGKNTHLEGFSESYVDFNRAGTPLLEVVTQPDIKTAEEAALAFKALRQIVMHLGICDGNLQEGSMRADINVSIRKKGSKELNTRTETKNLNSFKFLKNAVTFEFNRQVIEVESGNTIKQETRLWDPNLKESRSMRSKEDAHDYRYLPDPDLLPLVISDELINTIKKDLIELPLDKNFRYQRDFGLSEYDATILANNKNLFDLFESAINLHNNPKIIANWLINEVLKTYKISSDDEDFSCPISADSIASLVKLIDTNVISSSIAKKVFAFMVQDPSLSPQQIIKDQDLAMSNQNDLEDLINRVIKENPLEVQGFKAGKDKLFGFLMGQLMKLSKGRLDPKKADELLKIKLKGC
jgi:aspartyl-tRNA(Asn)/glutamyl-tRNA(Gln) amidotransferase subunit B